MPHLPGFSIDLLRLCLWLAILSAIFIPLERLFPLHRARIAREGLAADLGYYFLGGMATSLLLSIPLGAAAWVAHRYVPEAMRTAFDGAPFWKRALAALVVGEIGYYWGHRLMHEMPLLWRFHAIHHGAEAMDFLVDARAHPVDLVFGRLCATIPLYLFGLATPATAGGSLMPALVVVFGTIWAFFIHANLRWRLGWLEWAVTSPRFHHWHHAVETTDRNYASMLPWLDVLFGTAHLPRGQWPARYGLLGAMPKRWVDQLIGPFVEPFPAPADRPANEIARTRSRSDGILATIRHRTPRGLPQK